MSQPTTNQRRVFTLAVDVDGGIVLPPDSQVRLAAIAGEVLVGIQDLDGSFRIVRHSDVVREVQDYFAAFVNQDESLSEEFSVERREEALRE